MRLWLWLLSAGRKENNRQTNLKTSGPSFKVDSAKLEFLVQKHNCILLLCEFPPLCCRGTQSEHRVIIRTPQFLSRKARLLHLRTQKSHIYCFGATPRLQTPHPHEHFIGLQWVNTTQLYEVCFLFDRSKATIFDRLVVG